MTSVCTNPFEFWSYLIEWLNDIECDCAHHLNDFRFSDLSGRDAQGSCSQSVRTHRSGLTDLTRRYDMLWYATPDVILHIGHWSVPQRLPHCTCLPQARISIQLCLPNIAKYWWRPWWFNENLIETVWIKDAKGTFSWSFMGLCQCWGLWPIRDWHFWTAGYKEIALEMICPGEAETWTCFEEQIEQIAAECC